MYGEMLAVDTVKPELGMPPATYKERRAYRDPIAAHPG
jgi:hypothetical protein